MSSLSMEQFQGISALLTGFDQATLFPSVDPIKNGQAFYDTLMAHLQDPTLSAFTDAVAAVLALPAAEQEAAIASTIMADDALMPVARSIINMWYLGSWDDFTGTAVKMVSSQAYVGGLVWTNMRTHAMGYSQSHFGYWSQHPDQYEGTEV